MLTALITLILILMFFLVAILVFVFWIWTIVDCTRRDFRKENDKIVWILLIIFTGPIGSIIYYFEVHRRFKKVNRKK